MNDVPITASQYNSRLTGDFEFTETRESRIESRKLQTVKRIWLIVSENGKTYHTLCAYDSREEAERVRVVAESYFHKPYYLISIDLNPVSWKEAR